MRILSWKIGTKLSIAFLVLVFTMLSTAAVNWVQVTTSDHATDDALKRARVLRLVDNLVGAMVNQETGVRGYLVSGDEAFLDPYKAGQAQLVDTAAKLKVEWTESPDQLQRLDAFLVSAGRWKADVAEPEIALMKVSATQTQAREKEASGAGKATMDAMRAKATEMSNVRPASHG